MAITIWNSSAVFGAYYGGTAYLDVLYPYLGSGERPSPMTATTKLSPILICPGKPDTLWKVPATQTPVTNYMYNNALGNSGDGTPKRKLSKCTAPSKLMTVGDYNPGGGNYWLYMADFYVSSNLRNHKTFSNFLYVDGHSSKLKYLPTASDSSGINIFWVYWDYHTIQW